jgi:2-methylisocitrate lyase-like PEP mutase family enzyme
VNMRKKLRDLIAEKDYIVTPGCADAMHAKIVEKAGFDFVYMTGYGTSLALFGMPDVGLLTGTEMITNAKNIAKAVNIPVIADSDTGFGNAINVIRTVEEYEAAGVAGIHIEDQVSPKRCGHVAGKMIIPFDEAVGKIAAAVDAKIDNDFMVIARTDAISAAGGTFNEALKRAKAYADAGADMIFCEFPSPDYKNQEIFAEEMHKGFANIPLFYNFSSSFQWYECPLTFNDIANMGYKVIVVSLGCVRVSIKAVWDYTIDLINRKEQAEKDFQVQLIGHPVAERNALNDFAGFSKIRELEAKYLPNEKVVKKYENYATSVEKYGE